VQRFWTQIERKLHKFVELPELVEPDPGRFGLALVCIAKNEEKYIREWVEFHAIVGVRHFYIYVNDNPLRMQAVLQKYIDVGLVSLIPWQNLTTALAPQTLAYAHALANFGHQYRWMGFIDVDEFLFPMYHNTLDEALALFLDVPGVSIPWHMFGPSGHDTPPEGLVTENYTKRAPFPPRLIDYPLLQYKSIVDPCAVKSMKNSHWFYLPCGQRASVNEQGHRLSTVSEHFPSRAVSNLFRLNHYFTRSKQEIQAKLMSGRADRPGAPIGAKTKRTKKLWRLVEKQTVEDTAIFRFLPKLKSALGDNLSVVAEKRDYHNRREQIARAPLHSGHRQNPLPVPAKSNYPEETVEA